jgi:hypothetical protein
LVYNRYMKLDTSFQNDCGACGLTPQRFLVSVLVCFAGLYLGYSMVRSRLESPVIGASAMGSSAAGTLSLGTSTLGTAAKDERGAATVMVFLSPSCPCSGDQLFELVSLHREYSERGIKFLVYGVENSSPEDSISQVDIEARKQAGQYPTAAMSLKLQRQKKFSEALGGQIEMNWSESAEVVRKLNVEKTPFAVMFDPSQKMIYRGGILSIEGRPVLRAAVIDWRARRMVRKGDGRSLGCAIRPGIVAEKSQ